MPAHPPPLATRQSAEPLHDPKNPVWLPWLCALFQILTDTDCFALVRNSLGLKTVEHPKAHLLLLALQSSQGLMDPGVPQIRNSGGQSFAHPTHILWRRTICGHVEPTVPQQYSTK
jgi:hypothetical protein